MIMKYLILILLFAFFTSCSSEQLHQVSVEDFEEFVESTGYITDAERLGSTFIQNTVFDYEVARNVNWRKPDGLHLAKKNHPVTQVSYNDAKAYCEWRKCKLPSYQEYWDLVSSDIRKVNTNSNEIMPVNSVNIIGNVWELTEAKENATEIRLAGGSFLCNTTTCNGTDPNRILTVDRITSNSHIGFCILINN